MSFVATLLDVDPCSGKRPRCGPSYGGFFWTVAVVVLAVAGCGTTVDYNGEQAAAETSRSPENASDENQLAESKASQGGRSDKKKPQLVTTATPGDDPLNTGVAPPIGTPEIGAAEDLFGQSPTELQAEEEKAAEEAQQPVAASRDRYAAAQPSASEGQELDKMFSDFLGGDDNTDAPVLADPPVDPAEQAEQEVRMEPPATNDVAKPREEISIADLFGGSADAEDEPASQPEVVEPTAVDPVEEPVEEPVAEAPAMDEMQASPPASDSLEWLPSQTNSPPPVAEQTHQEANQAPRQPPAFPPTPIEVNNTRHLAWLLGSRVSLTSLSHLLDEATPLEDNGWQLQAMSELLGVAPPGDLAAAASGATPARAIGALLQETRRLAAELAPKFGDDHAALLEVAVKTNTLLMLYEKNPALAAPIRRAVEAAAPRAGLADSTWLPLAELLIGSPTADEVRAEVFRMHAAVERSLQNAGQ